MKTILLTLSLLLSSLSFADTTVADAVEKTVRDNMRYMVEENSAGVMSTIHSQSLTYQPTNDILMQIFGVYTLAYEITSYRFVGFDGELAYARVKQTTRKVKGPAFQNNEIDMLQIFKQEKGVWKLWSQANMEIKYL